MQILRQLSLCSLNFGNASLQVTVFPFHPHLFQIKRHGYEEKLRPSSEIERKAQVAIIFTSSRRKNQTATFLDDPLIQ